ncbi:heavy metal-responsive transcriptional regulator [Streptomyces sp. NPDC001970]
MRTGELAAASGLTAKTIRFYEDAGLLPEPPRTPGGYRDYPPQAAHRLAFIRDAQSAGLTLAEIRSILALRDSGEAPCAHVTDLIEQHLADIERRMTELRKTRTALRGLGERAAVIDPSSCTEADICRIIGAPAPSDNEGLSQGVTDNLRLSS